MNKTKFIGESHLIDTPQKPFKFKLGPGVVKTDHIADAAITASLSDEGPAGSTFGLLQAQMKKLKKGKSVKLKAKVKKGKRKVKKHRKVLWESSDPTVARVSGSGKVKAK